MFRSDFRIVADYFVQARKTGKYKGSPDEMKHVYEGLELLSVMSGDENSKKARVLQRKKRGIHNMSEAMKRMEKMAGGKREANVREEVAKDMLAIGRPVSEVVQISELSKFKVMKLEKAVAAAVL